MRILVCYEEHSGATGASSDWEFNPDPLEPPVFVGGGTHRKYLAVVKKGTVATLTRVSNRGNVRIIQITINEPVFLDFLGDESELPEDYVWYAKRELGWNFDLPKVYG